MRFIIADHIFSNYPETVVGLVIARGINNVGEEAEINSFLRQQEAKIVEEFSGVAIDEHPRIARWRAAYKGFGAKPKKYYSSIESLIRRVTGGHQVPNINKLVNAYNGLSLKYVVPAGGEDLDEIRGDIALTLAGNDEAPVRLIGERDERPPSPGEVIYKDDLGAICRRWNWREADRTKLTEGTTNAVLVVEALSSEDRVIVERSTLELADLINRYCGGSARSEILEKQRPAAEMI
jgi:DNA/RNA-binding domain of Phe-tRNA-synthetase-like protein